MNWMEACAARDGPDVVYALGKPIKPKEKTRVSMGERPAGGRARASNFVTRNASQQGRSSPAALLEDGGVVVGMRARPSLSLGCELGEVRHRGWRA